MFFQETTPDTSGYMIAGYAIAFLVMAIYVASIYLRSRNLYQDVMTLEEMDETAPAIQSRSAKELIKNSTGSTNHKSPKRVTKKPRKA